MPLILDYEPTAALYRRCGEARLTMARIGYSDQHHLLGIVEGAARFARDHAVAELPLGIFSTVGHYVLQMLPRYLHAGHALPAAGGDPAAYRRRLTATRGWQPASWPPSPAPAIPITAPST